MHLELEQHTDELMGRKLILFGCIFSLSFEIKIDSSLWLHLAE